MGKSKIITMPHHESEEDFNHTTKHQIKYDFFRIAKLIKSNIGFYRKHRFFATALIDSSPHFIIIVIF